MPKRSKKHTEALKKVDRAAQYDPKDALELTVSSSYVKFDETVDVAVRLGVDPRHADQMVRGTVVLPNGLGKEVKVLVFAKGEKEKEALDAGADFIVDDERVDKIKNGWFGFDKAINELKAGKIEFRVEKAGIIHVPVGKISFGAEKLTENVMAFLDKLTALRPASSKGAYMKSISVSSTMGPGIKIDPALIK